MLIVHQGARPRVASTSYVAPTAVLCGDVTVGEDCRIMFGAVLAAEGAPISIGPRTIIMENAVLRAWPELPVMVGHDVYVGPAVSVNGATLDDEVYLAAGSSVLPGAVVGARSIVRTNAVVHIKAVLAENRRVPDGWTAIGDPAQVVPPGADERTLVSLEGLNFSEAVFGERRDAAGTQRYLDFLASHFADAVIDEE
jgi:carbonic anhydrase/acetyltransferase-like protein (isoleucine patch superfamily)